MASSKNDKTKRAGRPQNTSLETLILYILNKVLYPYQRDFILDDSRFRIAVKSRQIGMSLTIAFDALMKVMRGEPVYFLSRSERQAIHLLEKFYHWCDFLVQAGIVIPFSSKTKTDCKIATPYGNIDIKSLTTNNTTSEGYTGHIYFDEFALLQNSRELYNSVFPSITSNDRYGITIISRPFGQSGLFYDIYTDENKYKDYSRHYIDINRAIKDGLKIDLKSIKSNIDDEGFRENYLCEFIDESTSYFTYDILRKCVADIDEHLKGRKYLGIDIGRTNDATSIVTLTKDAFEKYQVTSIINIKNKTFQEQNQIISKLIQSEKPEKVFIDKTGIGYQIAEDLESQHSGIVKGMVFNLAVKNSMITQMKKLFEETNIKIPDDVRLITDIHSIKRVVSSANNLTFKSERTSKGHSDTAWGLALAVYAAVGLRTEPKIRMI